MEPANQLGDDAIDVSDCTALMDDEMVNGRLSRPLAQVPLYHLIKVTYT